MKFEYPKEEKLKSEALIAKLFAEGRSVSLFPFRLIYLKTEFTRGVKFKTGVSVGKRNFKNAVDRNRIKRLLREAYRLNKLEFFNNTNNQYALMILYLGKDIPDFNLVNSKLKLLFGKFSTVITKEKS